jgi:ribose transport system substrate-binding protein
LNTYSNVDGIFTPNEPSTNGMLLAVEKAGIAGKVKFVGFDGGKANMDGLAAGHIQALILQDPYQMGYKGVTTMLDFLAGKKVDANVDTGTHLLTKDNQDTPEIKTLLAHTVM